MRDVVIVALTDGVTEQDLQPLAYVGMSRAKAALYVVGSAAVRRTLKWTE